MLRSAFFPRSLVVAMLFVGPALAASCGGDSDKKPPPPAPDGSGGAPPEPVDCGPNSCEPLDLPVKLPNIPATLAACCTPDGDCGLDSSFLGQFGIGFSEACQARDQAGPLDSDCPNSPPLQVPNSTFMLPPLQGCCRAATNTCGYLLKPAGLIDLGLGCVDSMPFLDGGSASPCGSGAGGAN